MALTLTPRPTDAGVRITVTDATTVAVQRIDSTGVHLVRHAPLASPWPAGTVLLDRECPLIGTATYRALTAAGLVTSTVAITLALAAPGTPILTVPVRPSLDARPLLVLGLEPTSTAQTTVHEVIGRADPITSILTLGSRRGPVRVLCADEDAAAAVADLYAVGEVVMLRVAGRDRATLYHVATDVRTLPSYATSRPDGEVHEVEVSAVEVRPPSGVVITSPWTYADLADSTTTTTYAEVLATYATYTALLDGPA